LENGVGNQDCLFTIWRKRKAEKDMTRNEKKRFDIIEAARLVFLEKGYELTSMDEIAKKAGVSKRTVYSNFGSKEELFSGLMNEVCRNKRESVALVINPDLPMEEALIDLGERFLHMIFDPEGIILFRMLIGNASSFPDMGQKFYDQGPKEVTEFVAKYLSSCADKGLIKIADPFLTAQSLLSSMFGAQHIRCLITTTPPPDEETQREMVRIAVHNFLHGAQL
jgi:AcrR family transcriptional regulator